MRDDELRGIVLEALYDHRHRDRVNFDNDLKALFIPFDTLKSIVRQLEEKGLIEYSFKPRSGLGSGRITAKGRAVVEGKTSPLLSSVLHQHISDVQIGTRNINVSGNIATDQAQARQGARQSFVEWISKLVKGIRKRFGLNA